MTMLKTLLHKTRPVMTPTNRHGFTLMELLVGMTLFLTIMASVTVMFNTVVRTTKMGYQSQIAYEVVRGVFDTMDQDVTRAFTSRETGLKDTFYGTPLGFTFIGMIDAEGDGNYNLARITYVVFADEQLYDHQLRVDYEAVADDDTPAEDRATYSLLRYIEPGVDSLDSFPVNWTADITTDFDLLGDNSFEVNLQGDYITPMVGDPPKSPSDPPQTIVGEAVISGVSDGSLASLEAIERALKCELWIRMLAGDAEVPAFWSSPANLNPPVRVGTFLEGVDLFPADYVLAENILHIRRFNSTFNDNPQDEDWYTAESTLFSDGVSGSLDISFMDSPLDGLQTDFALIDLDTPGSNDYFFSYREYDDERDKTDEDGPIRKIELDGTDAEDAATNPIYERVLSARDFGYWNDTRNLEHNVVAVEATPDIIDPALPESIQVQFVLFYPSPYPGAPDFERTFTHQIDLPTAFRRKSESIETKLLRNVDVQ